MAVALDGIEGGVGTEACLGGAVDVQVYGSKLDLFRIESQIPKYLNEKEQVVRTAYLSLLFQVTEKSNRNSVLSL